jgi:signal transduction histidine kinase/CheY-like chemotaxis protein/HPt (histidine-containing phosphotransfer) domain-containing protein
MFTIAMVGVVLLVLMGHALYVNVHEARESSDWVEHTHAVLESATRAQTAASRLEESERLVMAVGAVPQLRAERADAAAELLRVVETLMERTKDNAKQQERGRTLGAQINHWAGIAQRDDRGGGDPRAGSAESPDLIAALSAIKATLAEIDGEERDLLASRREREVQSQERTLQIVAVEVIASILLLSWAWWDSRRRALGHARAESRFRELVQALPVSLWLLRSDPRKHLAFEFLSDNAVAIRHIDIDLARSDYDVAARSIHEDDRQEVALALQRSVETLQPFSVDFRVQAPDGSVHWIHSSAKARRDADGSVLLSGYWADVTRERELRHDLAVATQEATTANRAKGAFLAAMSHEIRTPMNGVLGLLELLSLTRLDAEQKSTLSVVRASGESLLRIVDDILDFSKMEADRLVLNPAPASVARALNGACQIQASHASGKGLLLRAKVDPDISPVLAFDEQRLGQILNNLIGNALKFTERGSVTAEVRLLSRHAGRDKLAFVVADTGIGVAEQDIGRLFTPFMQSGPDTASRFGGTGLGLVISRRLAELMGGTLEMQSAVGVGTTMTLTCEFPSVEGVPLAAQPGAQAHKRLQALVDHSRAPPSVGEAHAEGTLVLLVDDHPTNRMVLRRQVNSLGYAAETAVDGRQAFDAWKTGRFALIIADCNMPEMTGHELARAVRSAEQEQGLARTPIFACTANAMPTEKAACLEAGMDEYLLKPTRLHELARSLQRWLPLPMPRPPLRLPVDQHQLTVLSGGDRAVELDILAEYRRAHEEDVLGLRGALARSDLEEVSRLAHRIRGACLALGSGPLAEATVALQDATGRGPMRLQAAMQEFEREFQGLLDGLDTMAEQLLRDEPSAAADGPILADVAPPPKK